jgi:branched-chain amino acid transport system substrate-binding protein
VDDPTVLAYIGPLASSAAMVSIPILNRAHLAMVGPTTAYPGLTKPLGRSGEPDMYYPTGMRNFVRLIPTDDLQGEAGALWASTLSVTRVYVLDAGRPRGQALARMFASGARDRGLTVVGGPESIDPQAASYRGLVTKIRDSGAELVYFGGTSQSHAGELLADLHAVAGNRVRFMGSDGLYNQLFLDQADDAAEGAYITFNALVPELLTGNGAAWYERYVAKYGAAPGTYTAYGYDAASVTLDAIRRAGTPDREAVRAALLATTSFDGVLGRFSFDANGDTTLLAMTGREVHGGRFDDAHAVILSATAPPAAAGP